MNLNRTTAQSSARILLSNVTACQILANIAVLQLYYARPGYAFDYYDTYIWDSKGTRTIWTVSNSR